MKPQERNSQHKTANHKRNTVSLLLAMIGLVSWFALPALAGFAPATLAARQTTPQATNVWTSNGPEGAEISSLAIAPGYLNTIFAGTCFGCVFNSNNGGASWSDSSAGLSSSFIN